jgi:hypothetical protein
VGSHDMPTVVVVVNPGAGLVATVHRGAARPADIAQVGGPPRYRRSDAPRSSRPRHADQAMKGPVRIVNPGPTPGDSVVSEPRQTSRRDKNTASNFRATPTSIPDKSSRLTLIWTIVGSLAAVLSLLWALFTFKPDSGSTDDAAMRIQACEATHHLTAAHAQQQTTADTTVFASCDWPPVPGADPDGYTAITNTLVSIPGGSDATGDTWVRRITGPCTQFALAFTYGHMGDMKRLPILTFPRDSVVQISYVTPTPYDRTKLLFYPDRSEVDVVQNDNLVLDRAGCIQ